MTSLWRAQKSTTKPNKKMPSHNPFAYRKYGNGQTTFARKKGPTINHTEHLLEMEVSVSIWHRMLTNCDCPRTREPNGHEQDSTTPLGDPSTGCLEAFETCQPRKRLDISKMFQPFPPGGGLTRSEFHTDVGARRAERHKKQTHNEIK